VHLLADGDAVQPAVDRRELAVAARNVPLDLRIGRLDVISRARAREARTTCADECWLGVK